MKALSVLLVLAASAFAQNSDLGTLAAAGAKADPSRQGSTATVIGPCDTGGAGGTFVVTGCSAGTKVVVTPGGDTRILDGSTAAVSTTEYQDTVQVGEFCGAYVEGPGSPVRIGWGSEVDVKNTSQGSNMKVTKADGTNVYLNPGEKRTFPALTPPPGV